MGMSDKTAAILIFLCGAFIIYLALWAKAV